ncbi:hypothetical protein EJB05_02743 [Eragrostis curvula]|uniref:trehalose-phosphatase n=1 Tax=Eragrostis curvula TaxID=38414 RepID=A0A5J9WU21_9POAL|nr:hypothetical protein EJB05_02743 [Eragrostis curvula]
MVSYLRLAVFLLSLLAVSGTLAKAQVSFGLRNDQWNQSGLWDFDCTGSSYAASNSYVRMLKDLENVLPEEVSSSNDYFATRSVGNPRIYALGICRADTSINECRICIAGALRNVQGVCGPKMRVSLYYSTCTIALSNTTLRMFPIDPTDGIATWYNHSQSNIERKTLDQAVASLTRLVEKKTVQSARRFATGQLTVDRNGHRLYMLAQCVPVMTSQDCHICLVNLIGQNVIGGLIGGRKATIWCSYQFELYQFYNSYPILPPPKGNNETPGSHHKSHKKVGLIVGLTLAGAVLLLAVIVAVVWWIKKRSNSSRNKDGGKGKVEEGSCAQDECPSALERFQDVVELVAGRRIAMFLDYDGTLSPIVNDPETAYMSNEMREMVRRAANLFDTAIVSGRSRRKVTNFVKLEELSYAGSHGMDIMVSRKKTASTSTGGSEIEADEPCLYQPAADYLPLMQKIKRALEVAIIAIEGAAVEDNVFSISVHYRNVQKKLHDKVKKKVKRVLKSDKEFVGLRMTTGKMVFEVRPPIEWNKGNAVVFLLESLKLDKPEEVFPIYIGDDRTDEDAFKVLRERGSGVGILVSEENKKTLAYYTLRSPEEVREFLELLVTWKPGESDE